MPFKRISVTNAYDKDLYYFVVRKKDCAYRPTDKTLDDLLKPRVRVTVLSCLVIGEQ